MDEYGKKEGEALWKKAAPAKEVKKDDAPEKRRDPNEPKSKKTYTKKEFVDEYGKKEGEALWKKAAPAKEVKKVCDISTQ